MKYKKEFKKNMKWGIIAIGIVIIAVAGYYFHAVQMEFDAICSSCSSIDCMDNNIVCGDFGIYYWKFATLFALGGLGSLAILKKEIK